MKKGIAAVMVLLLCCIVLGIFSVQQVGRSEVSKPDIETASLQESQGESRGSAEEQSEIREESREETGEETDSSESQESGSDPEEQKEISLYFAGDVYFSKGVLSNYSKKGLDGVLSPYLQQQMTEADFTMFNEEFPFSTRGIPMEKKQYTFRVDPAQCSIFRQMGADVVSLANNHSLDYGKEALTDTMSTLDRTGIAYIGAGDSLERAKQICIKEANGIKVGYLAASRVIPVVGWNVCNETPGLFTAYDPALLLREIENCRAQCDYLVVYLHWGEERQEIPRDKERMLAYELIDAGADAVIGAHPHVLQSIEYYKGKPIFYSLGNYIFSGGVIFDTMGLTVKLRKSQESMTAEYAMIPARATYGYTAELEGEEASALRRHIEKISYNVRIGDDGQIHEGAWKEPSQEME